MKRKPTTTFKYSEALQVNVNKLASKLQYSRSDDAVLLRSIRDWCKETGVITKAQLSVVGKLYKRYLQHDNYVHHNWKIWQ